MKKDYMSLLSGVTAVLVVLIAIAAFVLSFDALESLAESNGIKSPLSYLFPLIIDGAMIAFSLSALRGALAGERTWWAWVLIVSFTAVSMTLNGLHANEINVQSSEINYVGIAIAALAPLVVLLTFETFMTQIKTVVQSNIGRLQSTIEQLKSTVIIMKSELSERDETIIAMQSTIDKLQERSQELMQARRQVTQLEKRVKEATAVDAIPETVGEFGRALLQVVDKQMTAKEFSEIYGKSESWVSRTVSEMNGFIKTEGNN